jgi:hypothetical protein
VSRVDGTSGTAQAEAGQNGSGNSTARPSAADSRQAPSVPPQASQPVCTSTPQQHHPLTGESAAAAPTDAGSVAAFDIVQQADALAKRLAPLFPCDGPLEEYRIPAEATWTAIVFVDTIGRLGEHLTAPLVDRINRFSMAHAAAQASAIESAFSIVTDEESTLTDAALAERRSAAAKLVEILSYVRDLVHFHEQRSAHSDYQVASTSELMGVVFAGQLQALRDDWLCSGDGKLFQYLAALRSSATDSGLHLLHFTMKANIAEHLSPLDDLLRPQVSAGCESWAGYARLSLELSSEVAAHPRTVADDISRSRPEHPGSGNETAISQRPVMEGGSKVIYFESSAALQIFMRILVGALAANNLGCCKGWRHGAASAVPGRGDV